MREGRREGEKTIKIVGGFCLLALNESVVHCEQSMIDIEDMNALSIGLRYVPVSISI